MCAVGGVYAGNATPELVLLRLSLSGSKPKAMRVGLTISIVAHSATLVAVLLCFPLHPSSSPQVIPVSVATIGETENPGFQVSPLPELGFGRGSVILKSKPTLPSFQAKAEQTLVVAKLTEPPPEGNQPSASQMPHPLASNQSDNLLIKRLGQSRKMRVPKLPQVNRCQPPKHISGTRRRYPRQMAAAQRVLLKNRVGNLPV